MISENKFK